MTNFLCYILQEICKKFPFNLFFLILNPCVMRMLAARGFSKPPDTSRQYCQVPAVSLLSGYLRKNCFSASGSLALMKHSPDDSLYTPDTNPKQSQHQQFSPTKAPL